MKLVNDFFVSLYTLKKYNRWVITSHVIHQNHIDVEMHGKHRFRAAWKITTKTD